MKKFVFDNVSENFSVLERRVRDNSSFSVVESGDYEFYISEAPKIFYNEIVPVVENAFGSEITVTHNFLRLYTKYKDNGIRIHTDALMGSSYAWILYMSDAPDDDGEYGTAFFSHYAHGKSFPYDDVAENNRLLAHDSHNLKKWKRYDICEMKRNRLLIFSSNYFHSRFPFKNWGTGKDDGRLVYVGFFNID
jgi:hypothetical protein